MSIFDILPTFDNQYLIAIAKKGNIYIWDINTCINDEMYKSNQNTNSSCYRSLLRYNVSDNLNYKIDTINNNNYYLCSNENIKIGNTFKLLQQAEGQKVKKNSNEIKYFDNFSVTITPDTSKQTDYFYSTKCLQTKLYIGCASGSILIYDIVKQTTENIIKFPQINEVLGKKYLEYGITALDLYRNDSLLLAGTSGGRLHSFDLNTLKPVIEFKENSKGQFSPITKIECIDNKAIVCHQEYITKWNLMISDLINFYQFPFDCQTFLKKNDELIVGGNVSEIIRIQDDQPVGKWETSFESTLSIKEYQNFYLASGIGEFVDVFNKSGRICSLSII